MTSIELEQHPELAALVAALRRGETVEIRDHGQPVARCLPTGGLEQRLRALHSGFQSPPYPGNSVIDMRHESR